MIELLEEKIGYVFHDKNLLKKAMTHTSYANETGDKNHHLLSNEQLEFLGDSILQVISSDYLYTHFPKYNEGDLSKLRSLIVCENALATYTEELNLGDYLLLGKGESEHGRENPAILSDAFEALLGAMFLDGGEFTGIETIRRFLVPFLEKEVQSVSFSADNNTTNAKSALQEFLQKDNPDNRPEYRLVKEEGPDHCKTFSIEVWLDENCIGKGEGSSKKKAEQEAAKDALHLFGISIE